MAYVSATATVQQSYAKVTYQVATEISNGAIIAAKSSPVISPLLSSASGGGSYFDINVITTSYSQTTINCYAKGLWIGRISNFNAATYSGYAKLAANPNEFGIGVFASQSDNNVLCIMTTQPTQITTNVYGETISGLASPTGIRYLTCNNGTFGTKDPCSAGFVIDPQTASNQNGVRVAKSKLIIGGAEHYFDFGFVNASAVNELQTINVNIIGQAKNYMAVHSFGSAGPSYPSLPTASMSVAVLPTE